MNKYIFTLIYAVTACSIINVQHAFSQIHDTIPPEYTWISPKEFSIQTTNNVRVCVDAFDNAGGSGIQKVVFIAWYVDEKDRIVKKQIGEVLEFPFEITWNCSHMQDQSIENLQLFCEVFDNAGNVTKTPKNSDNPSIRFVWTEIRT